MTVTKEDFPSLPKAPPRAGEGAAAPIKPAPAPAPPLLVSLVEAPSEADPVPVLGVSKPKKTTSLALFDLVLTPKKRQSQREKKESAAASASAVATAAAAAAAAAAATAASTAGISLSAAATGGGKTARPKRKKKLSGLKKKLLLERLEAHLRAQAVKAGAEGATESSHAPSSSVAIRHFVGDCDEEDEAQEMLGDARTILSAFGIVARVFLVSAHRYRECCTKHHGDGQEPADGETLVVGQFSPSADGTSVAAQAARGLTGMLFGGVAIQAFVVDSRCEEELRVSETSAAAEEEAAGQEPQNQQQPAGERDVGEPVVAAFAVSVLYLDNVVSSDECEDEDEARESLTELVQLCGSAVQGPCRPVACWLQFRSANTSDGQEEGERAVSACVSFSSAQEADAVRAALHGRVLGGRAIAATVEAAGAPRVDVVIASIVPPPPAPPADSLSASAAAAVAAVAAAAAAADAAAAAPVSKYTAAKAAPKQAKRAPPEAKRAPPRMKSPGDGAEASAGKAAEDVQDGTSGGVGAADDALPGLPYSLLSLFTPVAPVAVEDTIKSLLKAVAAFQTAALQKDPAKARYNKRFVLGMKQTINAIRAGNARLVLLPPDVEASVAVDKMMQTLLLEAHRRAVPVAYCLSRRRLGKALGNDMRQSAAAIYNPDGAYEDFKKVMVWLDEERLSLEAARQVLEVLEEEAVAEAADRARTTAA